MSKVSRKNGILEVARLAGVSQMTVTRTFNGSAPVSEKTRKAVMAAAEKIGYKPDPFARILRGLGTQSIGLIWGLGGPHASSSIVRDIAMELHQSGYAVYINDSLSNPEAICNVLRDYASRRVEGVILQVHFMKLLEIPEVRELLSRIPAIVISPEGHDIPCDKIILDYYRALEDIVDHFAHSGRKKVVAIGDYMSMEARLDVFQKRLEFHGLDTNNFLIQRIIQKGVSLGEDFVNSLTKAYPEGKYPFDAVWTSCDEGAAAVINHLTQSGYRVPEDIAVAGFNNNEMSTYFNPPIASVERMNDDVKSAIIRMLLPRIKEPGTEYKEITIHMAYVNRRSAK